MSYVGQTCSEKQRKRDFLNLNIKYGGNRIENARIKYKPENFQYEILEIIECDTIEKRNRLLNEREIYYIVLFDSFNSGYNNTMGGGGTNGYQHTDEYKIWQSGKTKELAQNSEYIKKISTSIKSLYEKNPSARIKNQKKLKGGILIP